MIQSLRIENLAVIETLELELGNALNVFTGETGAGKSVLLHAVQLLSGRRVAVDTIRAGADEARVEAIFDGSALLERAVAAGLAEPDDEELLVVRTLARKGRSRVLVNGKLATVAVLAELLDGELEITSQGEHQHLLKSELQGELLDQGAQLAPQREAVAAAYADWYSLARSIHERRVNREERARREDQLRFEIDQIESVEPRADELESLEQEHQRLAHVDRLGTAVEGASKYLEGDGGAAAAVSQARVLLEGVRSLDPSLSDVVQGLERAELELAEAVHDLDRYAASLESDPQRLDALDRRLGELSRLQERYGSTLPDVLAYLDSAKQELETLAGGEDRMAELEAELAERASVLGRVAAQLSKARLHAGSELAERVDAELEALELGRASFSVALEPLTLKTREGFAAPAGPNGSERAIFELAANPGEPARALRDAASGGELARLLLAIRNVLRDSAAGGVLLFDEVDAGIGGRTAQRVGERLQALASSHQILCVTHLAPIAALGDSHYEVVKEVTEGRTRTQVRRIKGSARVDEIARLSGSGKLTAKARAHAKELLARS